MNKCSVTILTVLRYTFVCFFSDLIIIASFPPDDTRTRVNVVHSRERWPKITIVLNVMCDRFVCNITILKETII